MKQLLTLSTLCLLIFSCNQKYPAEKTYDVASYDKEMMAVERESQSLPAESKEKFNENLTDKQKIIKDGRIGIKVTELEEVKRNIDSLVRLHKGYYAKESYNNTDYESSFSLKVRIPGRNFEKFIADVEAGTGEILYKEIDARDVTDQFIDLETRLENKRSYLKRYNQLLSRAGTVKDILEIEEKIRVLEEEIESTEGQLNYLSDQVAYSTLDLWIAKERAYRFNPVKRDKFTERLKYSLSKGWFGFVDFLLFLIKIWPLWVIIGIAIPVWRRVRKNKKAKNKLSKM